MRALAFLCLEKQLRKRWPWPLIRGIWVTSFASAKSLWCGLKHSRSLQLLLLWEERGKLRPGLGKRGSHGPLPPGNSADKDSCSEEGLMNYQHLQFSSFQVGAGCQPVLCVCIDVAPANFSLWVDVSGEVFVCTRKWPFRVCCVPAETVHPGWGHGPGNFISVLYNFLFIPLCPFDLVVLFPSHEVQLQKGIKLMNDLIALALKLILNNWKSSWQITFPGEFNSLCRCLITRKFWDRRETNLKC